jgi:hypothetical protein
MATKSNPVNVVEVNDGTKIDWEQSGTKIFFGDDEIMVNVAKYQRDEERTIDIVIARDGTLAIGADSGIRYAAQIEIPANEYNYIENEETEETEKVKVPLDMANVILKLWSID